MTQEDRWERRARELLGDFGGAPTLALQLGREMAEERAEEIAKRLDTLAASVAPEYRAAYERGAVIARSTILKNKTREQVLTDALQEIRGRLAGAILSKDEADIMRIASSAVEWKT